MKPSPSTVQYRSLQLLAAAQHACSWPQCLLPVCFSQTVAAVESSVYSVTVPCQIMHMAAYYIIQSVALLLLAKVVLRDFA